MRNLDGNDVVELARGLLGTPWQHQGRFPGVGVDCVGLVALIAREMGYRVQEMAAEEPPDYGRDPVGGLLEMALQRLFVHREGIACPGDLLLFESAHSGRQHLGIQTDIGMIHAQSGGMVCEVPIDDKWLRSLKRVYAWDS